jgi:hypothetical protein
MPVTKLTIIARDIETRLCVSVVDANEDLGYVHMIDSMVAVPMRFKDAMEIQERDEEFIVQCGAKVTEIPDHQNVKYDVKFDPEDMPRYSVSYPVYTKHQLYVLDYTVNGQMVTLVYENRSTPYGMFDNVQLVDKTVNTDTTTVVIAFIQLIAEVNGKEE